MADVSGVGAPLPGSWSNGSPVPLPPAVEKILPEFLAKNPLFCAGFGLAGLGIAASYSRGLLRGIQVFARRRFLTSLEVPVKDPAYPWVMQWLIGRSVEYNLAICCRGRCSLHLGVETTYGKDVAGNIEAKFNFVPSTGTHVLRFKNALIWVERSRSGEVVDFSTGSPWETLTLTTLAIHKDRMLDLICCVPRSRSIVVPFSAGGGPRYCTGWRGGENGDIQKSSSIYITAAASCRHFPERSTGQEWRKYGEPKRLRPFNSVVLADGVAESILADVRRFQSSAKWYVERGIPYRRGYLLHGPPGCGKSSFVMALAGELKYNICVMNVADPMMTDDRLQYLLATVPPRSLLLLEDIDSAIRRSESQSDTVAGERGSSFRSRASQGDGPTLTQLTLNPYGSRSVTYSGLLNALDGVRRRIYQFKHASQVVATEERIIFLTTNQPERLPQSLVRPGRVDLKVRIGYATPSQLKRQFLRFFPNGEALVDQFVEILRPLQITLEVALQPPSELSALDCRNAESWRAADEEVVQELQLRRQSQSLLSGSGEGNAQSNA